MALVARASSSTLPSPLQSAYAVFSALLFQGVILPPACTRGTYAFTIEVRHGWGVLVRRVCPFREGTPTTPAQQIGLMVTALVVWSGTLAVYACVNGRIRSLGRVLMTASLLLYPPVSLSALSLLSCKVVAVTSAAVASLDGGAAYVVSGFPRSVVSVPVLTGDSFYVCYAGSHKSAFAVAAVTAALFVALLPLVSLVWLCRWASSHGDQDDKDSRAGGAAYLAGFPAAPTPVGGASGTNSATKRASASFVVDPFLYPLVDDVGYRPECRWLRLADLAAVVALAALQAWSPRPGTPMQVRSC